MLRSVVKSCPWLAARWNKNVGYEYPTEDNACYLWEDSGVPPEVGRYCAGTLPWRGERYVPVPVEDQFAVCLTEYYGSCRWLKERQWYKRETQLVCPLLGTALDRRQKYLYPTSGNVCHARVSTPTRESSIGRFFRTFGRRGGKGTPIGEEMQRNMCLTEHYPGCPRYRDHLHHGEATEPEARAGTGGQTAGEGR